MSRSAAWLRWAGRLVGSLYFAFFMFFLLAHLFGSEPDDLNSLTAVEIGVFITIGISQLGVMLCWWRALPGAYVMLIGWVGLICLQWFLIFSPFFGLPAIAGALLILAARRDRISPAGAAAEKGCRE
jgi:hypothetical protein